MANIRALMSQVGVLSAVFCLLAGCSHSSEDPTGLTPEQRSKLQDGPAFFDNGVGRRPVGLRTTLSGTQQILVATYNDFGPAEIKICVLESSEKYQAARALLTEIRGTRGVFLTLGDGFTAVNSALAGGYLITSYHPSAILRRSGLTLSDLTEFINSALVVATVGADGVRTCQFNDESPRSTLSQRKFGPSSGLAGAKNMNTPPAMVDHSKEDKFGL